ncbi:MULTISPECIES: hypothetical protein [unclassified Methylobacterium]|uniref:hypothetical protein n=1 Tax=unclassified Methylobacterium TaxID=2615210 RepID=UPI0012E8B3F6|nr:MULTISPECIES: hypothetical protein [unclassified Methylobacterium]MCK2056698.1 hypothetical protein [Methylobacterium sp. 37f]
MNDDERFEAMADACLKAHEAVVDIGKPVMLAITRALLWQVGQELSQREARREKMLREAEDVHRDGADPAFHPPQS